MERELEDSGERHSNNALPYSHRDGARAQRKQLEVTGWDSGTGPKGRENVSDTDKMTGYKRDNSGRN